MSEAKFIKIDEKDNVATALKDARQGDVAVCGHKKVTLLEDVRVGHKIALENIKKENFIYKYGHIIGVASADIKEGESVHVHNLEGYRGRGDAGNRVHDSKEAIK